MLTQLSIRNIVLIEKLDLEFGPGLWVLTGETGAGKSILLDALGLAVGGRADKTLVSHHAAEGTVSAEFKIDREHSVRDFLDELGLAIDKDQPLILRRMLKTDGRSKAFLNDQPVSISTLGEVGTMLLEVHGQHAERDILEPASHRAYLDLFAGAGTLLNKTRSAHARLQTARAALHDFHQRIEQIRSDRDYYQHASEELRTLNPESGEEAHLASRRSEMMNAEKIAEELKNINQIISSGGGVVHAVAQAYRTITRAESKAPALLQPLIEALDRAAVDLEAVEEALQTAQNAANFDPNSLDRIEERLFAIRAAARKYKVEVEDLPKLQQEFDKHLTSLDHLDEEEKSILTEIDQAQKVFTEAAQKLSEKRKAAATKLDAAIKSELKPLKLDKARFQTNVETVDLEQAGEFGIDRIKFEISTNPGAPFGPLTQIASGGEFARFVLALKAVVAQRQTKAIVVFDEVDQGVSGAVAEAVGERLSRLSDLAQVLVITHSPQVAVCGHHHLKIRKTLKKQSGEMRTSVKLLDDKDRLEEIARMLSGAKVTDEARAAAARLLEGVTPKNAKSLKTGTSG